MSTGYSSIPQLTSNQFDYYSGSQITVWFGNIYIDDIYSIQWLRSQNKLPIYGYASQLMDKVANGVVTIQGNFTINFRQKGYISSVINTIQDMYVTVAPTDPKAKADFDQTTWPEMQELISSHLQNGTFGPQTLQEIQDLGNSDQFNETASEYEKAIWYENSPLTDLQNNGIAPAADTAQADAIPDGFDINIAYGNQSYDQKSTLNDFLRSTNKTLSGVHIIGESQIIQVGGQNIQEQYSFIARDSQ